MTSGQLGDSALCALAALRTSKFSNVVAWRLSQTTNSPRIPMAAWIAVGLI
jgi:hypothetical protein